VTGRQLRAWRLTQRQPGTLRPWTQKEAGIWYGCPELHADRTWRRWESGEVPVPKPLAARIKEKETAPV
jgi:hypothetical protein